MSTILFKEPSKKEKGQKSFRAQSSTEKINKNVEVGFKIAGKGLSRWSTDVVLAKK